MSAKSPSMVMLRRNAKHVARNPTSVFNAVLMPILMLFMFVYMMGDAFSVGVDYVDYATPGRHRCGRCWTGSARTHSAPRSSPSTHPTSTTFSSP